jgi:hypothetical protein
VEFVPSLTPASLTCQDFSFRVFLLQIYYRENTLLTHKSVKLNLGQRVAARALLYRPSPTPRSFASTSTISRATPDANPAKALGSGRVIVAPKPRANLAPTPSRPRNRLDHIAPLEGCAVEGFSGDTGFRVVRLDACVLDSVVRDQICKPVVVYISKVILECARLREIV